MSRGRRLVAHLIVAAILIGQAVALVRDRETWPFSTYPMFSYLGGGPWVEVTWLFEVGADGRERPLKSLSRLQTFRLYPLEKIIERVRDRPDGDRLLDKALCELLRQYTSMRRRGEEDGPPLAGLRLYSLRWERDPRAGNVDRPSGRVLLAEALAAPGGAR